MKSRDESMNDALLDHIDPEHIEKAPEGFTSRVMENVLLQPALKKRGSGLLSMGKVPLISALVILVFVVVAALIPGSSSGKIPFPDILNDITLPSIRLNLDVLSGATMPAWLPYLFLAIFFLLLLDKALSGIFHRQKK